MNLVALARIRRLISSIPGNRHSIATMEHVKKHGECLYHGMFRKSNNKRYLGKSLSSLGMYDL
jgi:hypothetical protein